MTICLFSDDEALTSYVEFTVQKISPRHQDPMRRTLCLTETCLVERDPATYNIATVKPLCDVSVNNKTTCKSLKVGRPSPPPLPNQSIKHKCHNFTPKSLI